MAEFRPPVRALVARRILGLALFLLVVGPVGAATYFLNGPMHVIYRISEGKLQVQSGDRVSGDRTVALSTITEARAVQLEGGVRKMGTGFPGFCVGRFAYSNLGEVWQATNCSRSAVVVRSSTNDLPIVMTPPDPQGFVERLRQGDLTYIPLPEPDKSEIKVISWGVLPVVVLSLLMVLLVITFGAERLVYRVEGGELLVSTVFSSKRWPTSGMRARRYTPGRTYKLAGTGAPGYYTGLFRQDGVNTRVYATDLKQGVLIEGPARIFLSPESPDSFLRALEREGAEVVSH